MIKCLLSCAAWVSALAAFSLPALAEPTVTELGSNTPIDFASGPFAGVAAKGAKHMQEQTSEDSSTVRTDTATFETANLFGFFDWSRLPGGYRWQDTGFTERLSVLAQDIFKASGFTVLEGNRTSVNGYIADYRQIEIKGSGERCGVFALKRAHHLIQGVVCGPKGRNVPVQAVMQGLSIDGVIGP